jgi:uncharacterized protein (TIGR03437 family)
VACLELHSKKNAVGEDIIRLVTETFAPQSSAVRDFEAFVISGDAEHFSVGANLLQLLEGDLTCGARTEVRTYTGDGRLIDKFRLKSMLIRRFTMNTHVSGISSCISGLILRVMRLAATLLLFALPKLAMAQQTVAVTFNYQTAGTIPGAQTFSVAYPTSWLLSGQLYGGSNWLNASLDGIPIGQSASSYMIGNPTSLRISVNPIGLGVGTYTATVHLFTATVQPPTFSYDAIVTLTVSLGVPQYADSVYFNYKVGGVVPAPSTVSFPSQANQATGITASANQPWILVSLTSTSTPTVLTIGINPINMAAGSYSGAVVIGNSISTWRYDVYLTVTSPVTLTAVPSTMTFSAVQGRSQSAAQTFQVTASIANTWIYQNSASLPSWLLVNSLATGATPVVVLVSVNPSGLAPGTYSTSMGFYSIIDNATVSVPIRLVVTPAPPVLQTNTNQLQFQVLAGSTASSSQSIQVSSSGTALNASISLSAPWLTASVLNGTTPFTVNVGVNPTGMAVGTYNGQVTVTSASSPTQTVNVSLTIAPDLRPVITSVVNGASFKSAIGPGTWISIMGSSFAGITSGVSAPFLPSLNGVTAQLSGVGGVYSLLMYYLSPTQINAFVPLEIAPSFFGNSCSVAVTTSNGTTSYTTQFQSLTPALFNYGTQHYASATHLDGTIVGVIPGTLPAQSGSIITLWGTGFGQTTPPTSTININYLGVGGVLASPVIILVNNTPATVLYAGMVGVGLYQFNIQLPDGLASGDYPVTVQISGVTTDQVMLPVR